MAPFLAGAGRHADDTGKLDRSERTVFPRWAMGGIRVERDGKLGDLCVLVSGANGKWQVSSAGGQEPRWRHDGKELFYLSADGKIMAAAVTTDASFKASSPLALFQTHRRQPVSLLELFSYDVSGDGQRFLILTKVDEANAAPLSVLLNWASEMEK